MRSKSQETSLKRRNRSEYLVQRIRIAITTMVAICNSYHPKVNVCSRLSALPLHILIFILFFTTLASGMASAQALQEKNEVHLGQFDLLTSTSGWVLLDQHVFW